MTSKLATGGIIKSGIAEKMQDGVVGYTFGGKPVFDANWFDERMGGVRNSIRIKINAALEDGA